MTCMNRFHNKRNHITFTASVIRTNNTFFLCFSFNLFSNFPSQCILFRDWNCIGKRQKKIIRNSEEIYVNEHTCVVCFAYEEVNKQKKMHVKIHIVKLIIINSVYIHLKVPKLYFISNILSFCYSHRSTRDNIEQTDSSHQLQRK